MFANQTDLAIEYSYIIYPLQYPLKKSHDKINDNTANITIIFYKCYP